METDLIKKEIKEIIIDVLKLDLTPDQIDNEKSLFGSEDDPESGIIQDSLVVLEIATVLSEKYNIDPSEFNEQTFMNINSLADLVIEKGNLIEEKVED
ncbi:hypothetical protein JET18_13015 [Chryseobacterium sp. L7]|uniref:Carrier domain-containing protein n=2 Tax=Chryseobacterium TaxID=59732 RepID=A0A0J7IKA9_9FLAO|nr:MULTISPECIES: hypothetical protein [Chryseobacterium]KMQ66471.1 hypothetical protein ACM46_02755 [Chryseobacterium angstadtii]MBL1221765.1 hypothetical protein [Chryseobacterium endalhagicum]